MPSIGILSLTLAARPLPHSAWHSDQLIFFIGCFIVVFPLDDASQALCGKSGLNCKTLRLRDE